MKIIVNRKCFYNGGILKVGEIVEVKGDTVPCWGRKLKEEKAKEIEKNQTNTTVIEQTGTEQTDQQTLNLNPDNSGETETEETETPTPVKANVETEETEENADDLAGKTEEELNTILNDLLDKTVAEGILLDGFENKTVIEQIEELRKKLQEIEEQKGE